MHITLVAFAEAGICMFYPTAAFTAWLSLGCTAFIVLVLVGILIRLRKLASKK